MIVCNATPLISFARIGQLELLHKIVGSLVIPDAVAKEIAEHAGPRKAAIDLKRETWITVQPVQSRQQIQLLLPVLDRGESEVIALALEQQARLALIDELTGRKVAESLGLNVCGSVGLLMQAKRLGEIAAVKPI